MTRTPRPRNPGTALNRRHWLALAASGAVSACGGGGSDLLSSLPGTGGTGISADGPITGFGSVIVNGIRFDDSAASVTLNGVAATSTDLRLGMTAAVTGQRTASAGTASSIEVWAAAQGPVTQQQAGVIVVMGMRIEADAATTLDGITALTELQVGDWVTVWGLQGPPSAGTWTATRVSRASASGSSAITTGQVRHVGIRRSVNGVWIGGSTLDAIPEGQLLRVRGALDAATNTLVPDAQQVLDGSNAPLPPQGDAALEGVITAQTSATRFTVGRTEVEITPALALAQAAALKLGARVALSGTWQGRLLLATALQVSGPELAQLVVIEARIEQFLGLANFVVRGQRCDASGASVQITGSLADLRVGVKVSLRGVKNGAVIRVTALEIGG